MNVSPKIPILDLSLSLIVTLILDLILALTLTLNEDATGLPVSIQAVSFQCGGAPIVPFEVKGGDDSISPQGEGPEQVLTNGASKWTSNNGGPQPWP